MSLIAVYDKILAAASLEPVDGVVTANIGDGESVIRQPVTIGGKMLHLPTQEFLKNPDWEKYIAFHPLSESPMRGESEVLKLLRGYIVADFNTTLMTLMEGLIKVAANVDGHKRLSATASECLDAVPKADAKSVKDLAKVLEQMDDDSVRDIGLILDRLDNTNRRKLVNFYLKRAGTYKGKEYGRVCVVDFPFLAKDADETDHRSIFGVKLRVKDYEGFHKLFAFIVGTDDAHSEKYNTGTNTMTAPYLTVLLHSWFKLAKRLNKLVKIYTKHIPELECFEYDTSWESTLEDFGDLARELPPLEGNKGALPAGEVEETAPQKRNVNKLVIPSTGMKPEEPVAPPAPPVVQPQVVQQPQQPVYQQQVPQPQPVVYQQPTPPAPNPSTGPTWREMTQRANQQMPVQQQVYQQPVYQQPQVMYAPPPVYAPAPVYQQPVYQQQQPMYQQQQAGWASEALGNRPAVQPIYAAPSSGSPLRDAAAQQQQYYAPVYGQPNYGGRL